MRRRCKTTIEEKSDLCSLIAQLTVCAWVRVCVCGCAGAGAGAGAGAWVCVHVPASARERKGVRWCT